MDAHELKREMRLTAIEYLLCDLWSKYYGLIGATREQIETAHMKAIDRLKTETFSGLDAASSDLAASELEDAVTGLLAMQQEMLGFLKAK